MALSSWLTFVGTVAVLLIIPGPTVLTLVGYSLAHGRRASLPLIAAVALGDSTALACSLAGLGGLLAASASAFAIVKILGAAYLIYLGIKMFLKAGNSPLSAADTAASGQSLRKAFRNTYVVTATNPKGIVFYMAFLPQFLDMGSGVAVQMWILAVTFVTLAIINATLYTACAGYAGRALSSGRARRAFHLTGGTLLSAAGIWTAFSRRAG